MVRNKRGVVAMAVALATFVGIGSSTAALAADSVEYRLTTWKTMHLHDAKKAKAQSDTLRSLGCEVVQEAHGDHLDVRYRCVTWRRLDLPSHAEAHRWESWLKSSGFETKHQH